MYLAQLTITNFRKLSKAELSFQKGLNILVGTNNVGKTAVIDSLRALLAGHDEPYLRLSVEDIHRPKGGVASGAINFQYVFRDLDADDEADFLAALKPALDGRLEAHITVRYAEPDKAGRLRVKRWCGDHEEAGFTSDVAENLRGVYLPPLRDASQGLKPGRTSQLSRLLQLLSDETGRDEINKALKALDDELRKQTPIVNTHSGSTPLTRTLPRRPIIGKKECHVQAKKVQRRVQARRGRVDAAAGRGHQPGGSRHRCRCRPVGSLAA